MGNRSSETNARTTLSSVEKAFNIVEHLSDVERTTVSELSDRLELPKSTAHIYLKTLEREGFVIKEDGTYCLGVKFLKYGGVVRNRMKLYQTSKLEVDKLAAETGDVANLGIEENGWRVLLYKAEGPDAIHDNAPVGEYTQMHWTALGKAILAYYPRDRVDKILDQHGMPKANDRTITDRQELYRELEQIRERGFSVEDEDRRRGVLTVAAPIMDRNDDRVISAISVSGPKNRIEGNQTVEEIAGTVKSAANVVELKFAHY